MGGMCVLVQLQQAHLTSNNRTPPVVQGSAGFPAHGQRVHRERCTAAEGTWDMQQHSGLACAAMLCFRRPPYSSWADEWSLAIPQGG